MGESHSRLSPSKASRYCRCPVSVVREEKYPEKTSPYAEEGRLAHELAAARLTGKPDPAGVPADMYEPVQTYVDAVRSMSKGASVVRVETRVRLNSVLDEGESGTVDYFAILDKELQVHDLKYGKGVRVDADENEQLILYGLGALPLAQALSDIESVRLAIHQPRLGAVSEVVYTVKEMETWREKFASVVKIISTIEADDKGSPGEKQCMFCRAKADCPDLAAACRVTAEDFENVDPKAAGEHFRAFDMAALAKNYSLLPLVSVWMKAVEESAMERMLSGAEMPGYKLVAGRPGNRQWFDDAEAEAAMKAMKIKADEMYVKKVITPTAAEKLLQKAEPKKWEKLSGLITRTPPKPAIAPESDKRPAMAISVTADDFDDLTVVNTNTQKSKEEVA